MHVRFAQIRIRRRCYKFTGKERDSESSLDDFGARYYANTMGKFMSPDWSETLTPVPYASLAYPQSLNLYSYVQNNPVTREPGTEPGTGDGNLGEPGDRRDVFWYFVLDSAPLTYRSR
jgi:RHS repeat-associated protein